MSKKLFLMYLYSPPMHFGVKHTRPFGKTSIVKDLLDPSWRLAMVPGGHGVIFWG